MNGSFVWKSTVDLKQFLESVKQLRLKDDSVANNKLLSIEKMDCTVDHETVQVLINLKMETGK